MRLSLLFSANRSRRRTHNPRSARTPGQQFELRCLLSATSGLDPANVVDSCDVDDDFTDWDDAFFWETEPAWSDPFGDYFDEVEDEVVFEEFLDELDTSHISEDFALAPESIQAAIENLAGDMALDDSLFESADLGSLQIITLTVTASSGAKLPVDLFVWDGGADAVVTTEFLSQVESVLNDTLKDVLATGGTASTIEVGTTSPGDATQPASSSLADTYGIQPLEVYVDVSQDVSPEGSLYVSGVTVVSEDPLDSEFLVVDEFTFFADDFVEPQLETIESAGTDSPPDVTGPTPESASLNVAADDASESAAASDSSPSGSETSGGDAAEEKTQPDRSGTDSQRTPTDADGGHRNQSDTHDDQLLSEKQKTKRHDRDGDPAVQKRRLGHVARYQQRSTQSAQESDSTPAASRWQRLRIRATEVARQIAAAAGDSNTQVGSQSILPASTAPFALNWSSRLAAFIQPALNEQLLGLSDSETLPSLAEDDGQPTYAQLASATGALLIAAGATTQAVRRRHQYQIEARGKLRTRQAMRDTKDNYGIETE